MTKNDVLRKILRHKLEEIKIRNPSYSKRKLAIDSGISSGSLIDFLNGKRDFSLKTINRIIENCDFKPNEIQKIQHAHFDDMLEFDSLSNVIFEFNNEGVNEFRKSIQKLHRRCKKLEKSFSGEKTFKIQISDMNLKQWIATTLVHRQKRR